VRPVFQLPFLLALSPAITAALSGCEELGPDARGEIANSATQRIGVGRSCIPYFDVANVQRGEQGTLIFALRDGTAWRSTLTLKDAGGEQTACDLHQDQLSFMFATEADELCAGATVLIGHRVYKLDRHSKNCELGNFERI
jgi:hypothetical protein